MTDTELAYAAGLFDGEGCVGIEEHHGFTVLAQIAMTTPKPLLWMQSKFGGQFRKHNAKHLAETNRKDQWYWRIVTKQARKFLADIRPWLQVKDQQADLILSLNFYERGNIYAVTSADRAARDHAKKRLSELNKRGRLGVV